MANTFAFTGTLSFSIFPEFVSFGPYVTGGIQVLPNGEVDTIASVGLQVGLSGGLPFVEVGAHGTVLGNGQDSALTGWGGTAAVQIITQTGVVFSGSGFLSSDTHIAGAFGGFTSSFGVSANYGYGWVTGVLAPAFYGQPVPYLQESQQASNLLSSNFEFTDSLQQAVSSINNTNQLIAGSWAPFEGVSTPSVPYLQETQQFSNLLSNSSPNLTPENDGSDQIGDGNGIWKLVEQHVRAGLRPGVRQHRRNQRRKRVLHRCCPVQFLQQRQL